MSKGEMSKARSSRTRYTAAELRELPTLAQGQADDLKIDDGRSRVWLARCGLADGARYRAGVKIEQLVDGRWTLVDEYEGASS